MKENYIKSTLYCLLVLCFTILVSVLSSCTVHVGSSNEIEPEVEVSMESDSFMIYILRDNWHSLQLACGFEEATSILRNTSTEDSILVLDADDIEAYNWNTQVITLTSNASGHLQEVMAKYSTQIPLTSEKTAFVITLNDVFLYGGIFVEPGSAVRISYPVIYPNLFSEQVTFTLRPMHSVLKRYDDMDSDLKKRIENPDLYEFFNKLGKIVR